MKSKLLVKEKQVVTPGEELAVGMDYLPGNGTYRNKDQILALKLGLVYVDGRAIKLIPLAGKYLPKKNDTIIGKVNDVLMNGWLIDTNSAYMAMMSLKDATSDYIARGANLTEYYGLEDYVVAKIINVTSQKQVDLTMKGPGLRKLRGGRIIKVNPHKVPRVIGKQGSMVSMIKNATDCKIIVGQNGLIWIEGKPESEILAINTIYKIEKEAHIGGLTDSIKNYLDQEMKSKGGKK